jgi:putative oxygen-independent coproporphyrinogen III oxidase
MPGRAPGKRCGRRAARSVGAGYSPVVPGSRDTSVYVHFPWCLKKCPYCDFSSFKAARSEVPHAAYADAVLAELRARAVSLGGRRLVSVFFGGGTPSLWDPRELGRVLAAIRDAFPEVAPDLEVTVECNPTSLDRERAEVLRDVGVGRLSVGLQSLDAGRLEFLGRLHDAEGGVRALETALAVVPRASGDLIFGVPGLSADAFGAELARVLETGTRHVSAYALTIEPGTQFGELHKKGRLPIAPEDDVAETYLHAEALLREHGLGHYEVSNYATPGEEARHNLHYWRGGAYLGLGAGAVGCLDEGSSSRRWRNQPLPDRYAAQAGTGCEAETEPLGPEARVREALMLGLRTAEGVDAERVEAMTGLDLAVGRERAIERRVARGELVVEGRRFRVPSQHWLALDSIVLDLF